MKIHEIDVKLVKEICNHCNLYYHLSNYLVIRKKDNEEEEIFCYAGPDIINASNIQCFMNDKNDGYHYYHSEELTSIDNG